MTKARTLADMISDGVIGTTELADDVITPVKLDETGNYTVAQLDVNGTLKASTGSSGATAASNADDFVVEAGGDGGISILTPSANTGTLFFGDNTASNAGQIKYSHSAGSFSFVTEQNTRMTIDSSGRVGIKTSSPSTSLTINQNGATDYIRLEGPSSGDIAGGLQLYRGSTLRAAFYANPTHDLTILSEVGINFRADNGNRMAITSSGNVGINTQSPVTLENRTTLQVSGNIKLGSANDEGLLSIGDVNSTGANVGIWRGNGDVYGSSGNSLGLGGYSGVTITTGNSGLSSQSRRMVFRADGDIEVMNFQSAGGGTETNALYWKIRNSANTGQYARLGGIKAETVSNWGGKLKFYTKPANGTPNDTVTEQMVIDQSGRVTMPYQPAFHAYSGADQYANAYVDFSSVGTNIGNCFNTSTNRFTAPVAGTYKFTARIMKYATSGDSLVDFAFRVNGSQIVNNLYDNSGPSGKYSSGSIGYIVTLSAGDYVQVYSASTSSSNRIHSNHREFTGFLIG